MDKNDISAAIEKEIEAVSKFNFSPQLASTGTISSVNDGVATVTGLSQSAIGEVVVINSDVEAMVMNLKQGEAGVIVLGDYTQIKEGDSVKGTNVILSVKAGPGLLGRVVNPLSVPIDGKGNLNSSKSDRQMPVEKIAPGVVARQDVRTPLQTGIKAIDALVPIGRGQRELIIGDRGIGKTALAVDAIINQAKINSDLPKGAKKVISIYVSIGQRQAKLAQVVAKLTEEDAMADTIIVSASSSDSASLQYLAPFCATAMAEYFMDNGEDVLIVYDDLSKHAWAYRQLSLLLRRPSGREAYPGDIFYLHSRLLERSARMSEQNGGGSITALPIIETLAGDISAYIPTNVISITDGQIYLEPDLFYSGIRPAVSVGLSVSRVGGDAQLKGMKQVAGTLKLDLAQYRELAAFAQFGSDLDEATLKRLNRGKIVTEVLKQEQFKPLSFNHQVFSLWAASRGHLDGLDVSKVNEFLEQFLQDVDAAKIGGQLEKEGKLTDEIEKNLTKVVEKTLKAFK